MNARRAILAIALLVLAGGLAWAGLQPETSDATVNLALLAAVPLAAAVVLFVWRTIGSLLAIAGGALAMIVGVGLGFVAGFSGQPVELVYNVLAFGGIGVVVFAIIDIIALLSRRPAS